MPDNGLPEGWHYRKLAEVAAIRRGAGPKYESGTGLVVVSQGCIQPNGIDLGRAKEVSRAWFASIGTAMRIQAEDTLVNSTGEGTLGRCAMASPETVGLSFDSHVLSVRTDGRAHGSWVAQYLRSTTGQAALQREKGAKTTNQTELGVGRLGNISLPVPPADEQRRIAEVLDSIDAAIEKTEAVIAATEQLRSALLGELLTRGVPGWHTEWKQAPGVGTIPACWEAVRLGDLVTVRSGQADPRDQAYRNLLFVAPDDIGEGTGLLLRRRTVSEVGAISGKYEFDVEDVIYSKIRPYLRKVYLPKESGLCSADMYPIRPGPRVGRSYLGYALLSPGFTEYSRTCSDRTGIPKINRPDLLRYRMALPPKAEQDKIANLLNANSNATVADDRTLQVLKDVKGRVASALLSGRLRVGDLSR